jgi:uncharacterized surface protein with fasciclin (FAS1) repeats
MRTSTRIAATVASAGLIAAAMAAPASAFNKWSVVSDTTIVGTALALSGGSIGEFDDSGEDFDILVYAVANTEAINILDGSMDFTVFAPTDDAFKALGGSDDEAVAATNIVNLLGTTDVTLLDVLAYHVTEGVRASNSVTKAMQITMLDGNRISARGGAELSHAGGSAGFVMTDVRATDGVIHVIDTVLLPPALVEALNG